MRAVILELRKRAELGGQGTFKGGVFVKKEVVPGLKVAHKAFIVGG